jgi:uncharacterized membrane protein YecN with MAPEG domain
MNKHIVQLIRERFYPLVRFCGPQSAGEVEVEGVRATVYLGELSIWLWPAKALTMEFCPMNNSATWFHHICWFAICCCRRRHRCNVCHVTWTGLKRPTETPCHYCAITSKIPQQR